MCKQTILFLCAAVLLSSCQKALDYYNVKEVEPPPSCRVETIKGFSADGTLFHEMEFLYSDNGQLDGVSDWYVEADPEGLFTDFWEYNYDEQGRIIYTGPYSTPSPFAEIYFYEGNSRLPAGDTLLRLGFIVAEKFAYDTRGRIVEIEQKFITWDEEDNMVVEEPTYLRYYYDLRGNRQESPTNEGYAGLITYSDKPSLYLLSPVFQIQYKNWSKNSTLSVETFNEQELPTQLKLQQRNFQPFISMGGGYKLTYTCE